MISTIVITYQTQTHQELLLRTHAKFKLVLVVCHFVKIKVHKRWVPPALIYSIDIQVGNNKYRSGHLNKSVQNNFILI